MSIFSNPLRISSKERPANNEGSRSYETLADLKRHPVIYSVAPNSIDLSEDKREYDAHFVNLYSRYLQGKLLGYWTRVNIEDVILGFFRRSSNGSIEHITERADSKEVERMVYEIRCGFRPALVLYRGLFGESENKLVCSDDAVAYEGYRSAGIRLVPAMIIGGARDLLVESAICTRSNKKDGEAKFDSTAPVAAKNYLSILGLDDSLHSMTFVDALHNLQSAVAGTLQEIKSFHILQVQQQRSDTIHYHQTLYSVAYRASEVLGAIELLFGNGFSHQIKPLVRTFYELFLNFYIDWLCPEQVGPLLQSLALMKRMPPNSESHNNLRRSVETTYKGLADLCGNASAKANLSPLGKMFHESAYPILSQVVHQDFNVMHEYFDALEAGAPRELDDAELRLTIRWLDLIVGAMLMRIRDDVGSFQLS